ncbi:U2 small nuclear ribonucleoprotein A' [Dinochytrium kinnereticum]|nr:U2 small nuclear ribonucleoprotein A' [Dinochytrium kinnereticum]
MVKLDYEVLSQAPSYVDALKERALGLRGLKIARIENLAITKDQHDTIDLTNNDLRKLDNFPPMPRLKTLLLSNNRIQKIDTECTQKIPNLDTLILTNNQFSELGDLDVLAGFKGLTHLSLLYNPVTDLKHYREYVIFRCPTLRVLDFKHVWDKERATAKTLFSGDAGSTLLETLSTPRSSDTTTPAPRKPHAQTRSGPGPSPEEAAKIREAIKNATTLEEIGRLKRQLEGGVVPGMEKGKKKAVGADDMEEEED